MNMTRNFGRDYILSTIDIGGYYKFGEVFQIIALDDSHPKPPTQSLGHFPLAIEYSFEINKEQRGHLLKDIWVEADEKLKERLVDASYYKSKREEIMALMSLFTPSLFFIYNRDIQELSWFAQLGGNCNKICWGQKFYSPEKTNIEDRDSFSKPAIKAISRIKASEYYDKLFTYPGQNIANEEFALPDIIDTLFEKYYTLEKEAQLVFLQATTLFYQSMKIWFESKSLTYTALISSLETLVNYDYSGVKYAPCENCKTTQYQVMKKFRAFLNVEDLPPGDKNRKYVNMLYELRSQILHRGNILLGDSSIPGYYSFKEAEEVALLMNIVSIIRKRLLRWLLEQ